MSVSDRRSVALAEVSLDDSDACKRIEQFVSGASDSTIFHTIEWNRIVREVFGTTFLYIVALHNGAVVGAMPCHVVNESTLSRLCYSPPRQFEMSYGGPIVDGGSDSCVCEHLVHYAARNAGSMVTLFTSPQNSAWVKPERWKKIRRLETCQVNLSPSLDDIWRSSLSAKRRNMIRRAMKEGVEVELCRVDELDSYYDLTRLTAKRTGIACQPKDYYRCILTYFGLRDQARLYLAFHQGRPVAGGIFLKFGNLCRYWVGATDKTAKNLGQGESIQWEVIKWAKGSGCQYYDLVGVEPERLPQIAKYKLSFSRDIAPFYCISYGSLLTRVIRRVDSRMLKGRGVE